MRALAGAPPRATKTNSWPPVLLDCLAPRLHGNGRSPEFGSQDVATIRIAAIVRGQVCPNQTRQRFPDGVGGGRSTVVLSILVPVAPRVLDGLRLLRSTARPDAFLLTTCVGLGEATRSSTAALCTNARPSPLGRRHALLRPLRRQRCESSRNSMARSSSRRLPRPMTGKESGGAGSSLSRGSARFGKGYGSPPDP